MTHVARPPARGGSLRPPCRGSGAVPRPRPAARADPSPRRCASGADPSAARGTNPPGAATGHHLALDKSVGQRPHQRPVGSSYRSAVRLAPVPHAANLDGRFVLGIEEHTVVATAKPEAGARRLELFHVAVAVGQIASTQRRTCMAVSRSMARRSARASGYQMTAIRSAAVSSLTDSARTRAGSPRVECLHRERAKRASAPAPRRSRA